MRRGLMRLGIVLIGLAVGVILAEGGRLRVSTRRLWQEARAAKRPWWQFFHTYTYARWPFGYIGAAIGERRPFWLLRPLFAPFLLQTFDRQHWGNAYHGKVMPLETVTRLVTIQEDVQMAVPEQVIPFEHGRDLILAHPQQIVALDCPCRVARAHPCEPLDVCLIVGEPFASFVLEHHPDRARAISQQEAVAILEAEAQRGHVHHAFFKEAMLNRFYAICNCCACCCGALSAHRHGIPMVISSGYVSQLDPARCRACGACATVCPFQAIQVNGVAVINAEACMGCGVCTHTCPQGALSLQRDESKPAPLEISVSRGTGAL